MPGSSAAEELIFTWTHATDGPVRQRQVYASFGDRILYLTFTERDDGRSPTRPRLGRLRGLAASRGRVTAIRRNVR